jgi:hypothetical protein
MFKLKIGLQKGFLLDLFQLTFEAVMQKFRKRNKNKYDLYSMYKEQQ